MNEAPTSPTRPLWKTIFLSPDESRLRAGWRLAIQTALMLAILIGLSIPAGIVFFLLHADTAGTLFYILNSGIELVAFTASIFLARRFLDRRSIASLGLQLEKTLVLDLLAGLLITFVMMGGIYLVMAWTGWVHFTGFAWQADPLPRVLGQTVFFFLVFILVGWQEELLSRGYHLQTLASGLNLTWGVLLSSLIFGLLHLGNPNATWVSALGIFFAGLFLASGYLLTGRLWLSIGLHLGWNFFEGVVFGFPVSGLAIYPLMRIQVSGPEAWTGGAFGPEAGLIVLPAILIGTSLVFVYARLLRRRRT